ncbi:hypothetical protein DSUL_20147 [Desulfovibrionales bacterium]
MFSFFITVKIVPKISDPAHDWPLALTEEATQTLMTRIREMLYKFFVFLYFFLCVLDIHEQGCSSCGWIRCFVRYKLTLR